VQFVHLDFGEEYKYLCDSILIIDTILQGLNQWKPMYIFDSVYFNLFMVVCINIYFFGLRPVLQTEQSEERVSGESGC